MRVAFTIYGSLGQVSGGFIYDRALVGALTARGHQVDVVALPGHGYARALASNVVMPWRRLSTRRGDAPDVIIEDELIHPSLFLRGRPAPYATCRAPGEAVTGGAPRIALVHNLRCRQPAETMARLKARVERGYLESMDGLIAVCQSTLGDTRALLTRAGAPRRVIPALVAHAGRDHISPDVDDAFVGRRSREPGPLRILHVAAVVPHKGLLRLLGALAGTSATTSKEARFDFRLEVVGSTALDPAYVRRVRAFITGHDLASRVTLHGERQGPALGELFRRAQVMALPSDREAYSLACLEALGFGLPVMATACGGLAEMLTDGVCGDLLSPDDEAAWGRVLGALASDRNRLAQRGQAALARYRQHATWNEVGRRVEEFLLEAIARRRQEKIS
jgi:glycosyltransferase involved in cell wall biosynthesis